MKASPIAVAALAVLVASAPRADAQVAEISGNYGYTFSEGVSGDDVVGGDGNTYNELNPTSSQSYHFTFGITPTQNVEVGFLWGRQQSQLEAKGTATVIVGDMNVDNYHGYFAYNFGEPQGAVRPFVVAGIGATNYGSVSFTGVSGRREIDGVSRFSTMFGGGVKAYLGRNVGVKVTGRWTPTYIKSEAAGWWCDPFWGCYVISDSQYSNQFDFSGGLLLRF
jgi:hypothetical protein